MKNSNKAELPVELPPGISGELLESLINGTEEDIEAGLFVNWNQGVEFMVDGKDGMEILYRE